MLAHIDNGSGHYKPREENLRNCLESLQAQDVNVDLVRVCDWSKQPPRFYWGRDFLAGNRYPWLDEETPPNSFFKAPPIRTSV